MINIYHSSIPGFLHPGGFACRSLGLEGLLPPPLCLYLFQSTLLRRLLLLGSLRGTKRGANNGIE
jgi:hypothetical protein